MNSNRRKPGVAFCATVVLVVVLVGYPLSYGPFFWLFRRGWLPNSTIGFYAPMTWLHKFGPGPIGEAVRWWATLWQ
jgi:hypothetical protein